jgi:hemerythrin
MGGKSASEAEIEKTLNYLNEYVVKHFSDEEEIHIKSKYPKQAEHKEKHAVFIDSLKKLEEEFAGKINSMEFTMKLNNSLVVWIVKHIKGDDVEFGKFYKAQAL